MKFTSCWNFLFFALFVAMTADQVDCACNDIGILNPIFHRLTIDENCQSASGVVSARENTLSKFLYIMFGDIGNGNECQVYEGSDNTGPMVAVLTGNGNDAGPVRGGSLFFQCNMPNQHGEFAFGYDGTLFDDCGGIFSAEAFRNISSPREPGGSFYRQRTFCVWNFVNNPGCKYTFVLDASVSLSKGDFVFINFGPDNVGGHGEAVRYGNESATFTLSEDVTTSFGGTNVRMMFVSVTNIVSTGFDMKVYAECPPPPEPLSNLKCGEIVEINLNEVSLHELNATTGDILYIAPSEDVKPEDVDPSCVTTYLAPYFIFNHTQCVPVAEESDGVIKLIYIVWNQKYLDPSVPVQRYFIFCVNFTCEFESNYTVTSSELEPEIRKIGFGTDPVDAQFQVSLELYNNDTFEDPLADDATITVPQYVYAEVKMTDVPASADNFHVEMTSCWATLTDQPTASPLYLILQASCPVVNPFDPANAIIMLRNSQPIYGLFKFRSFVWTNVTDQEIYVHCDVTICDTDAGECPSECGMKRRRRSVAAVGEKHVLSAGPILIAKKPVDKVIEVENKIDYDFIQSGGPIQESHDEEMFAALVLVLVAAACVVILLLVKK